MAAVATALLFVTGGCAAHAIKVPGPGCSMAIINVPVGCYAREFSDRTEVNCPQGKLVYRCTTKEQPK